MGDMPAIRLGESPHSTASSEKLRYVLLISLYQLSYAKTDPQTSFSKDTVILWMSDPIINPLKT